MRPLGGDGEGSTGRQGRGGNIAPGGQPDYGTRLAEIFFPELADWRSVLARLGIPEQTALEIAVQAGVDGADFQSSLVARGIVRDDEIVAAVAADLGVAVAETLDPERIVVSEAHSATLLRARRKHVPVRLIDGDGSVSFLITPEGIDLAAMRRRIKARPALASRLKMVNPHLLRAAVLKRAQPTLTRIATTGLFERFSDQSARFVVTGWQGIMLGGLGAILIVCAVMLPGETLAAVHVMATLFFFACIALRFMAVEAAAPAKPKLPAPPVGRDMPVYSVLIALYKEARVVPDLLAAMNRLEWPRDRLEIRFVCEADDAATLSAIRAINLPRHVGVIEVPPSLPRTKPKALSYALPTVGGDFIALFDAEDDPHPLQLVEAWTRFQASGPDLASVQAPLEISNRNSGIVPRMFAFEYAALFRGLLPWLASRRLMLPLGGTSNHFRRAALEEVGGWDPYNVTEDADLGMRLARFGYRTETISLPTYEAAPREFKVWLPQRTRWLKGWGQTWLVHMRDPVRLVGDLGWGSFMLAQVLFAGMLASSLLHPVLLLTAAALTATIAIDGYLDLTGSAFLFIDCVNIACGYLSFLILGRRTMSSEEKKDFWKIVLFTPVYWMMMSWAGWRAVWELWRRPHHWAKTPH